jgi:hypothetical protein
MQLDAYPSKLATKATMSAAPQQSLYLIFFCEGRLLRAEHGLIPLSGGLEGQAIPLVASSRHA